MERIQKAKETKLIFRIITFIHLIITVPGAFYGSSALHTNRYGLPVLPRKPSAVTIEEILFKWAEFAGEYLFCFGLIIYTVQIFLIIAVCVYECGGIRQTAFSVLRALIAAAAVTAIYFVLWYYLMWIYI